jgi:hypothetical protein
MRKKIKDFFMVVLLFGLEGDRLAGARQTAKVGTCAWISGCERRLKLAANGF